MLAYPKPDTFDAIFVGNQRLSDSDSVIEGHPTTSIEMSPLSKKKEGTFVVTDGNHHSSQLGVTELIRRELYDELQIAITKYPDKLKETVCINLYSRKTNSYPLHYLCKKKETPVALVQAFVSIAPEAVKSTDSVFGNLPIHIACRSDLPIQAIQILIDAFPESLVATDNEGNLPLHLACFMSSPAVIKLLAQQNTLALKKKNKKRQTPLHMACNRYDISLEVVKALSDDYTAACAQQDWQQRVPLHCACMWNAETPVIEQLLRSHPESIRMRDRRTLTPYGILRKRVGLLSSCPEIKLCRRYRRSNGTFVARGMDSIRFGAESVGDLLGLYPSK